MLKFLRLLENTMTIIKMINKMVKYIEQNCNENIKVRIRIFLL